MKSRRNFIILILLFALTLVAYQNCGTGFKSLGLSEENLNSGNSPPPISPGATPVPSSTITPTPAPSNTPPPSPTPDPTQTPQLNRTVLVSGLNQPWDLAFIPDGQFLYTEKCNGLFVRKTDGSRTHLFGAQGAQLVAQDLFCEGQSGMHGVAIDPNFASNRFVYVYMASNILSPRTNRVVRITVSTNYTATTSRTDLITDIAFKNVSNDVSGSGMHSGGRIRFGADGFLYITTGDNHNGTLPQDPNRLGGKVLRVTAMGAGLTSNLSRGDNRIFTYGHRNVQGITFHPVTGQPFISEHGPGHSDEVTALTAGGNGGWDPQPDPGVVCPSNYCGYTSNKTSGQLTPMTDTLKFPNALRPVDNNGGASQGTGPCTFLVGPQWKAWNGRLAVGVMGAQRIDILNINSQNQLVNKMNSNLSGARARSLVQGPDGNLYVVTDSGEIWRVVPQ